MTNTIENNKNSLSNLLLKVQDQASRAADYLAPTSELQKTTDERGRPQIVLEQTRGEPTRIFDVNDVAFGQIASHAEIDTRTARRLQAEVAPEFDALLNAIWQKKPAVRMLRTHDAVSGDGNLRAFVSDKFKTFDNVNLLEAALPQLMDNPAAFQVVNADVTDKRLYCV